MEHFGAPEFVRLFDGLIRMGMPPSEEWTAEFFRDSANKIVRTAERVSRWFSWHHTQRVCILLFAYIWAQMGNGHRTLVQGALVLMGAVVAGYV